MSSPTPTMTLTPKRARRARSASPKRARSATPKRKPPARSAGKLVRRPYIRIERDKETKREISRGPAVANVLVFTYFLYDPNVRGANGRPKKIAVVKSRSHKKAALKGASRGLSQVMVRKADSPLVKVFRTSRETLNPPKVVMRGNTRVTFRTKPKANLTGYFLTPLYTKRSSPAFAALSASAVNNQKRVVSPLTPAQRAEQQRRLLAGRNRAAAARGGYKKSSRPGTPRRA